MITQPYQNYTHQHFYFYFFPYSEIFADRKFQVRNFSWIGPGLSRTQVLLDFFFQTPPSPPFLTLHFPLPTESHHYCQSSCTGPPYGNGTEIDWIGQWSHCKCITLTLPVLGSYLHTESHYRWESSTWHGDMYVLRVYGPEILWYKLVQMYHIKGTGGFVPANLFDVVTISWSTGSPAEHLNIAVQRWSTRDGYKDNFIQKTHSECTARTTLRG